MSTTNITYNDSLNTNTNNNRQTNSIDTSQLTPSLFLNTVIGSNVNSVGNSSNNNNTTNTIKPSIVLQRLFNEYSLGFTHQVYNQVQQRLRSNTIHLRQTLQQQYSQLLDCVTTLDKIKGINGQLGELAVKVEKGISNKSNISSITNITNITNINSISNSYNKSIPTFHQLLNQGKYIEASNLIVQSVKNNGNPQQQYYSQYYPIQLIQQLRRIIISTPLTSKRMIQLGTVLIRMRSIINIKGQEGKSYNNNKIVNSNNSNNNQCPIWSYVFNTPNNRNNINTINNSQIINRQIQIVWKHISQEKRNNISCNIQSQPNSSSNKLISNNLTSQKIIPELPQSLTPLPYLSILSLKLQSLPLISQTQQSICMFFNQIEQLINIVEGQGIKGNMTNSNKVQDIKDNYNNQQLMRCTVISKSMIMSVLKGFVSLFITKHNNNKNTNGKSNNSNNINNSKSKSNNNINNNMNSKVIQNSNNIKYNSCSNILPIIFNHQLFESLSNSNRFKQLINKLSFVKLAYQQIFIIYYQELIKYIVSGWVGSNINGGVNSGRGSSGRDSKEFRNMKGNTNSNSNIPKQFMPYYNNHPQTLVSSSPFTLPLITHPYHMAYHHYYHQLYSQYKQSYQIFERLKIQVCKYNNNSNTSNNIRENGQKCNNNNQQEISIRKHKIQLGFQVVNYVYQIYKNNINVQINKKLQCNEKQSQQVSQKLKCIERQQVVQKLQCIERQQIGQKQLINQKEQVNQKQKRKDNILQTQIQVFLKQLVQNIHFPYQNTTLTILVGLNVIMHRKLWTKLTQKILNQSQVIKKQKNNKQKGVSIQNIIKSMTKDIFDNILAQPNGQKVGYQLGKDLGTKFIVNDVGIKLDKKNNQQQESSHSQNSKRGVQSPSQISKRGVQKGTNEVSQVKTLKQAQNKERQDGNNLNVSTNQDKLTQTISNKPQTMYLKSTQSLLLHIDCYFTKFSSIVILQQQKQWIQSVVLGCIKGLMEVEETKWKSKSV